MAKATFEDNPERGYPKSVFFDDGEHGLEVEYMGGARDSFWFTIMGNHGRLSNKNALELIGWLTLRMKEQP